MELHRICVNKEVGQWGVSLWGTFELCRYRSEHTLVVCMVFAVVFLLFCISTAMVDKTGEDKKMRCFHQMCL
jgi:hypothetical protein